jgi:hypothetical protein
LARPLRRDLPGLSFGNLLLPALLVALGRRLLQGLHDLFAFGFLLTTGLDRQEAETGDGVVRED